MSPGEKKTLRSRLGGWLGVWWMRPIYHATAILSAVVLSIYLVGLAQRQGWIQPSTESALSTAEPNTTAPDTQYICPMMCTPPSPQPGRCAVCGMELVAARLDGGGDGRSVTIPLADRRLAGIKTVTAQRTAAQRKVRGVGVLEVDERERTRIPADVGGRVESLFVNFTGQRVHAGEPLIKLYTPDLYAAQTELLTLKKMRQPASGSRNTLTNVRTELITAARTRLVELGMTPNQIAQLERQGTADTRVVVSSPRSGTVVMMMVREGQYLKAGEVVCEVADLSHVWVLTKLFPEEAALVRYGQQAHVRVTSLPGESFFGRVSYVDPMVDPQTRSVSVRIEIPNPQGELRPGDEATVDILVPATRSTRLYDEQLAGKWICPEHPDEIRDRSSTCPRSRKPLVRTAEFGFADSAEEIEQPLVLPREAVLMAGDHSAVYVETEPGATSSGRLHSVPNSSTSWLSSRGLQRASELRRAGIS